MTQASTGIEGLDQLTGGGLPTHRMYLIEGVPGTGKTTLALQFLLAARTRGERTLYVTLSETSEELSSVAESHGWTLEGIDTQQLTSDPNRVAEEYTLYHPAEVELADLTRAVLERADQVKPDCVVLDSLSELRLLARDPLRYRRQVLGLKVLVFAPVGRDAELTHAFLTRAGIPDVVCGSMTQLCDLFEHTGAGALLLTEEALDDPALPALVAALERQPSWSEVPVLLFAGQSGADVTLRTIRALESLRNVTLFERPIRIAAALSAIRASLRARGRQYEVRDLLRQLHEARSEAEAANRLKDEFLATLSHELRTPLNAILGWTSMLTRGQVDAERMPRVFESLDRNARSQAHLIADVLDVSRIISGKMDLHLTTVDVGELVALATESVRMVAAGKDVQLSLDQAPHCIVRGDGARLQQVTWNLLSNAIKFTGPGGSIHVRVAPERDGDRDMVSLQVIDTGIGIAPDFLPQVFDRFRQADQSSTRMHGGLGLGLSIVKHLVELHGGTVSASSEGAGRGARFDVRLPAQQPDASPTLRAAEGRDERLHADLAGRVFRE